MEALATELDLSLPWCGWCWVFALAATGVQSSPPCDPYPDWLRFIDSKSLNQLATCFISLLWQNFYYGRKKLREWVCCAVDSKTDLRSRTEASDLQWDRMSVRLWNWEMKWLEGGWMWIMLVSLPTFHLPIWHLPEMPHGQSSLVLL